MIFRKRASTESIDRAKDSIERADQSLAEANAQRSKVDLLVNTVKSRRERNGFGEDFTIALTPRKAHP